MSEDDEPSVEEWRREGTCGACVHFRSDYGEAPLFYGHCKIYTRTGQRESNQTCGEFKPLEGFDERVTLAPLSAPPSHRSAALRAQRASRDAPAPPRRRARLAAGPRIVRRRRDGDEAPRVARDTRLVPDEVTAALFGDEGGGDMDRDTLRDVLLEVVESFMSVEEVELAPKWLGGTLTLQPADPDLKPHVVPVETFFNKIIMLRDRLRVLEAKLNGHKGLESAEKIQLQQYISLCYGSLTTFNVLFRDKEDKFSSK